VCGSNKSGRNSIPTLVRLMNRFWPSRTSMVGAGALAANMPAIMISSSGKPVTSLNPKEYISSPSAMSTKPSPAARSTQTLSLASSPSPSVSMPSVSSGHCSMTRA